MSTVTIMTIKDGEPMTATSTFSQFLSSDSPVRESVPGENSDYTESKMTSADCGSVEAVGSDGSP